MPNRPLKKPPRGRGKPTDYRPEYCSLAKQLYDEGAIDAEVADVLRVTVTCIRRWKVRYPDFGKAAAIGKKTADDRVERTLFEKANGFALPATKIEFKRVVTTKPDGSVIETYEPMIYEYLEYLPPSDAAIRMWLMNRRPDQWRERVDHNLSIDPNSPFERMMRRIDGESRRLPPGNDPDADREYAAADAIQRKRSPAQRAGN
jgi:hypothetical protein